MRPSDSWPPAPPPGPAPPSRPPALFAGRTLQGLHRHPRIHLDLYAGDAADQAAEVERLVSLGARVVGWDLNPDDAYFVVLADTDGNRFCVIDTGHR
ncbi:VOC family protein [Amycolatopsis sp. FDAARGOS 1241]|uniref:VOC family protein n=1 Tax=Amycolatopsis sp. FDAARGOS 1241 TaxID=2778070 RepID=UPI001EF1F9DD|nr:VOC family protein [Amycolatopsis sp. FDAARGOS 1241]